MTTKKEIKTVIATVVVVAPLVILLRFFLVNWTVLSLFFTQPVFQLFILLTTALSSYYLLRDKIGLTAIDVAKMSGAHLNYNPKLGENFINEKASTLVGFSLLLLSVLLQAYVLSQPLRWIDTEGLHFPQFVFVIIAFLFLWGLVRFFRKRLISRFEAEFEKWRQKN